MEFAEAFLTNRTVYKYLEISIKLCFEKLSNISIYPNLIFNMNMRPHTLRKLSVLRNTDIELLMSKVDIVAV